jgi:hypothetical protein
MPLPKLLIIGAMKAGTTGLYMDLASHPHVFLAGDKEPHCLCTDDVLTPEGLSAYEAIYSKAASTQICIDASTGYAKQPDHEGVAERAVKVLPSDFKVVYVVRHPIDRIISQHHHEHYEGKVGPSIDDEVRRHPRYVHYSRYSYQLEPWAAALGWDRIRVIRFEDYVGCRTQTVHQLCQFLGLSPEACAVDEQAVYNKSQGKPVKTRFWNAVQQNIAYRKILRPLAPLKLRLAVRRILFPKALTPLPPPRPETIAFLRGALADDVRRLGQLLRRSTPLWDDFDDESEAAAPVVSEHGIVR